MQSLGNAIGDKGASALAAILKETQITNLKCAAALAFAFLSAPIDSHAYSLTNPILPLACSMAVNNIGAEGASALAAILKETQITNLRCAAALECSPFCQRPLTRLTTCLHHARSLRDNELGPKGAAALAEGLKGNSTLQSLK